MLSSASSLVRLVYCYTGIDKVAAIWGTAQYHSRKNSPQLQPQQLQYRPSYLLHVFCVCKVSKECSRCFMGSHEVKSQRRYQVFMMKMCWQLGLSLFGWGHQSCPGCRSKWQEDSMGTHNWNSERKELKVRSNASDQRPPRGQSTILREACSFLSVLCFAGPFSSASVSSGRLRDEKGTRLIISFKI